jgi:hypothetical protein
MGYFGLFVHEIDSSRPYKKIITKRKKEWLKIHVA